MKNTSLPPKLVFRPLPTFHLKIIGAGIIIQILSASGAVNLQINVMLAEPPAPQKVLKIGQIDFLSFVWSFFNVSSVFDNFCHRNLTDFVELCHNFCRSKRYAHVCYVAASK